MSEETIVYIVTLIVTWILGQLAKKYNFIKTNQIPLQNLAIGIIAMLIEWAITKTLNWELLTSGLMAGGTYDLVHNAKEDEDSAVG